MPHKNSARYELLIVWIWNVIVSKWTFLIVFLSIMQAIRFATLSYCVRKCMDYGIHGHPWVKITNLTSGMSDSHCFRKYSRELRVTHDLNLCHPFMWACTLIRTGTHNSTCPSTRTWNTHIHTRNLLQFIIAIKSKFRIINYQYHH